MDFNKLTALEKKIYFLNLSNSINKLEALELPKESKNFIKELRKVEKDLSSFFELKMSKKEIEENIEFMNAFKK